MSKPAPMEVGGMVAGGKNPVKAESWRKKRILDAIGLVPAIGK